MSMVRGTVEAKSNKFDKHSILVNGGWYSSKFEIRCEKGDEVEFDDGDKKYCRKLKVVGSGGGAAPARSTGPAPVQRTPGFPVGVDTKDRSIVRQNSLGHAVNTVTAMMGEVSEAYDTWEDREAATKKFVTLIVETARMYEDYSSGDSDAREAAELLNE